MRKLELFLLYSLICFSLQDQYCVQTIDECVVDSEEEEEKDPSQPSTITNCLSDDGNGQCYDCKEGYAVSYDRKRCVLFENCRSLEEGDEKCEYCSWLYQPNSEGKCEKTFCNYHIKDVCESCVDGYYLKEKTCKKITIPNCLEWDEKVCKKCDVFAKLDVNGKCILQNLIKGCIEYQNDGKCKSCQDGYEKVNGGESCQYKDCSNGKTVQYCFICQTGFEQDEDGKCIGYDGTKDTSLSNFNKIQPVILMLIVALLI